MNFNNLSASQLEYCLQELQTRYEAGQRYVHIHYDSKEYTFEDIALSIRDCHRAFHQVQSPKHDRWESKLKKILEIIGE